MNSLSCAINCQSKKLLGPAFFFPLCILISILLLYAQCINAEAENETSRDDILQTIEEIKDDLTLTEENKSALLGQLETALRQLERGDAFAEQAAEYKAEAGNVEAEISRFNALLAEALANPVEADGLITEGSTPDEIESQIDLVESEREALVSRRSELLEIHDGWAARREAIQHRLVELPAMIEENLKILKVPAETVVARVRQLKAAATVKALRAEQNSLQMEMLNKPATLDVTAAERKWLVRALADADTRLEILNQAAGTSRVAQTRENFESVAAIRKELRNRFPELESYLERNQKLARQLEEYASTLETARQDSLQIQARIEDLQQDSAMTRSRLEFAGRNEILGKVMISRLEKLPDTTLILRDIKARNDLIGELSLNYFDADEELWSISSRDEYLANSMPDLDLSNPATASMVERLVEQRQQLLNDNNDSLKKLIRSLAGNNEKARQLIAATDGYQEFLIGNLMWVRNFDHLSFRALFEQLRSVFSPGDWMALPSNVVKGYRQNEWSLLALLVIFLLFALQKPLESICQARLEQPAPLNTSTLLNIVLCLLSVLVITLPWPLTLSFSGYVLASVAPHTQFLGALEAALMAAGKALYALLLIKQLIKPNGIGRRFLKWDSRMLAVLRREVDWAGPAIVVAVSLGIFALNITNAISGGPIGAIGIMSVALVILIGSLRLLREEPFLGDRSIKNALRLTAVLAVLVILLLSLGLLIASEVYLSAIVWSILAILGIKVLIDFIARALLILRASLMRRKRKEILAIKLKGPEYADEFRDELEMAYLSDAHAKLVSILRIVTVAIALWLIWSPTLPALGIFESMTLWQVADPTDTVDGLRPITLFDVILGVIILVFTGLIAKHLPSIIQIFLLEWVKTSAGSRYASGILMQYLVVAAGAYLFFSTIGWDWSNLQWLVAALGVGIGFGLQEIVANLISGIIILFEQPIRVGDTITAGGAEGTVKRISARATVIQTFEGKEHLIPNKALITGEVVNWSLTEDAVRVVIPVGIAYESDARRAMELLVEAAGEVDLVLPNPQPTATFEDFGDNSILLWLRCFVAEDRPRAWSELRACIHEKFRRAGIVIAFPQRDLHLDFAQALKVQLTKRDEDMGS